MHEHSLALPQQATVPQHVTPIGGLDGQPVAPIRGEPESTAAMASEAASVCVAASVSSVPFIVPPASTTDARPASTRGSAAASADANMRSGTPSQAAAMDADNAAIASPLSARPERRHNGTKPS